MTKKDNTKDNNLKSKEERVLQLLDIRKNLTI